MTSNTSPAAPGPAHTNTPLPSRLGSTTSGPPHDAQTSAQPPQPSPAWRPSPQPGASPWGVHLILGGQKSGKTRHAEDHASAWLHQRPGQHRAIYIATAQAHDEEMRQRIARHQRERAQRLPGMSTHPAPLHLAAAIQTHTAAHTLVLVDCLGMWLLNWHMPASGPAPAAQDWQAERSALLHALHTARGPVVLVGNEAGLGTIPLSRPARAYLDALGELNQSIAHASQHLTLMVAGHPLRVKTTAQPSQPPAVR